MVDRRESFQRSYDLAERVLPASASHRCTHARLPALGNAAERGHPGGGHRSPRSDYYRLKKTVTRAILRALAPEGAVLPVDVEGWQEIAYLDPADLALVEEIEAGEILPDSPPFFPPLTISSGSGSDCSTCSALTTASRCTPGRQAASTATMSCPSCIAAGW